MCCVYIETEIVIEATRGGARAPRRRGRSLSDSDLCDACTLQVMISAFFTETCSNTYAIKPYRVCFLERPGAHQREFSERIETVELAGIAERNDIRTGMRSGGGGCEMRRARGGEAGCTSQSVRSFTTAWRSPRRRPVTWVRTTTPVGRETGRGASPAGVIAVEVPKT